MLLCILPNLASTTNQRCRPFPHASRVYDGKRSHRRCPTAQRSFLWELDNGTSVTDARRSETENSSVPIPALAYRQTSSKRQERRHRNDMSNRDLFRLFLRQNFSRMFPCFGKTPRKKCYRIKLAKLRTGGRSFRGSK